MVVLDATIANIALPSAQHTLGFPNSDRQWVVTAYALALGSLLLAGGRIGDMFSRKCVRGVRLHRGRRRRGGPGPARAAHPVLLVALGPVCQPGVCGARRCPRPG